MPSIRATCLLIVLLAAQPALAGEADVLDVKVERRGVDTYVFAVTVRHADSGWDHYADNWQILGPDGTVLATRELAHPHVDEQPFTRTLDNVRLPPGITRVRIRAHDTVHELGGAEREVVLPGTPLTPGLPGKP
jgi:hypothetical protein